MTVNTAIRLLADYAAGRGLIETEDRIWAVNGLLEALALEDYDEVETVDPADSQKTLPEILGFLTDYAVDNGLCGDTVTERDLFDTKLMGVVTPRPSDVNREFRTIYETEGSKAATDWYYQFSQDTNYIRRERCEKDLRWKTETEFGNFDITINLSKPEKDPRLIAAAGRKKSTSYPMCQLCPENVGYAGRTDHPARENHRIIPITLGGEHWYLQYSPYVYYNEHCIVLNKKHTPMVIDHGTFEKLTGFTEKFPHYFVGSNADLPIVGGSILSHEHFQGGCCRFAMEDAPIEEKVSFNGYPDVTAGILHWPVSVIRLRCSDKKRLISLADRILAEWRRYSDPSVGIYAQTEGEPHNTITPIARRRDEMYEMDLALRNNRTSEDYPLGIFHPHPEYHHIKKENIGLIEVMGLAVLPARLQDELALLGNALVNGTDIRADERIALHADWADELKEKYGSFSPDNVEEILKKETGLVFEKVLEDAGVFKKDTAGRAAFRRFTDKVNKADVNSCVYGEEMEDAV